MRRHLCSLLLLLLVPACDSAPPADLSELAGVADTLPRCGSNHGRCVARALIAVQTAGGDLSLLKQLTCAPEDLCVGTRLIENRYQRCVPTSADGTAAPPANTGTCLVREIYNLPGNWSSGLLDTSDPDNPIFPCAAHEVCQPCSALTPGGPRPPGCTVFGTQ